MIYFSELKGKKVITEDQIEVGWLDDLIFLASENPKVTKLLLLNKQNEKRIVPINFLKKINSSIVIDKSYDTSELEENELYIVRNLLDKQIIDLIGDKVVRVNDVALQQRALFNVNEIYVVGVEVGLLGIFRSLKLENAINKLLSIFNRQLSPSFLSWVDIQPLELARGHVKLKKEEKKLEKIRPEDLANYLEKTNVINSRKVIGILDEKFAAEVIQSLNINYQTELFKHFKADKAAKLISLLAPDDAVDVLLTLSRKKRETILNILTPAERNELYNLLKLAKNPIGDLITSEILTVRSDEIVKNVIALIKKESIDFSVLISIYVVNAQDQLVGVFNLHELLLQNLDTPVYKFMIQNVIVAHLTTPAEIIFRKMLKYRIATVPVIDDNKKILGLLTIADVAKYIFK